MWYKIALFLSGDQLDLDVEVVFVSIMYGKDLGLYFCRGGIVPGREVAVEELRPCLRG